MLDHIMGVVFILGAIFIYLHPETKGGSKFYNIALAATLASSLIAVSVILERYLPNTFTSRALTIYLTVSLFQFINITIIKGRKLYEYDERLKVLERKGDNDD